MSHSKHKVKQVLKKESPIKKHHFSKMFNVFGRRVQFVFYYTPEYYKLIKMTYKLKDSRHNRKVCHRTVIYIYSPFALYTNKIIERMS